MSECVKLALILNVASGVVTLNGFCSSSAWSNVQNLIHPIGLCIPVQGHSWGGDQILVSVGVLSIPYRISNGFRKIIALKIGSLSMLCYVDIGPSMLLVRYLC